jgi:hypothetical protein
MRARSEVPVKGIAAVKRWIALFDAAARRLAREQLWHRDTPDKPLPADRQRWEWCGCRACLRERAIAQAQQAKGGGNAAHAA